MLTNLDGEPFGGVSDILNGQPWRMRWDGKPRPDADDEDDEPQPESAVEME